MGLETFDFISSLNPNNPAGADQQAQGDDHIRGVKKTLVDSFPNIDSPVTATPAELNLLVGGGLGFNPIGTIIMFGATSTPDGYLYCNGTVIDAGHVDLIALLGTNILPDMRGQFVRGMSTNANVDPDGPRDPLELQGEAYKSHTHTANGAVENGNQGAQFGISSRSQQTTPTTNASGGDETRPVNITVRYCIKY